MTHAWLLRGAEEQQHEAGARHSHQHLPTKLAADPTCVLRLRLPKMELPAHCGAESHPAIVQDLLQARWGRQGMGRTLFPAEREL